MINPYQKLLLISVFFITCCQGYTQINLDSVNIPERQSPWKIGTQFQAGVQSLGVQAINKELQARDYRAFTPIDIHFGLNFLLTHYKHTFGLGGYGYRNFNGDNFFISQFSFGGQYQYTLLKKNTLQLVAHTALHLSILELRATRPDPQFFPYSLLYTFPVNTELGIGIDKCTGFKGIYGRSQRLDVRVGARAGYVLPFNNQWYENLSRSQPIEGVPMVNSSGYFFLRLVVTSLISLGS